MLVELFYNKNWFISWLRYWWAAIPQNLPIPKNTYDINKKDLMDLIEFIAWETAYNLDKVPKIVAKAEKPKQLWESKLLKLWNVDYQNKLNQKNIKQILKYI